MAHPPLVGFHDAFEWYSTYGAGPNGASEFAFDEVVYCRGNTVRFNVYWDEVQPTAGTWNWGRYLNIAARARERGLKVLPILVGAPSWLPDRRPNGHVNQYGQYDAFFPGPGSLNAFGEFAVQTVLLFAYQSCQIAAIEVWNEPNLTGFPSWIGPDPNTGLTWYTHYRDMLTTVLNRTDTTFGRVGGGTDPVVWVLGGALSMSNQWKQMCDALENCSCIPWGLSMHPYSAYANGSPATNTDPSIAAMSAINEVTYLVDQVSGYSGKPIYVTETGCPSKLPFSEYGQQVAALGITNNMASRSRVKMMLLYRLFNLHGGDDATVFKTYPVLHQGDEPDNPAQWSRKSICDYLRNQAWL